LKQIPAPNVYNIGSKVGEGPKYHIGAKTKQSSILTINEVPGPGAYAPIPVSLTRSASYSLKGKHKIGT
jgi:hypothetical protein